MFTVWFTGCWFCSPVMFATSASHPGSIKSQLPDVFMSSGDILPLKDEMGEPGAFGNRTACGSGHVLAESSWADPARLPGCANGLLDAGAPLLCWLVLCWHLPLNLV